MPSPSTATSIRHGRSSTAGRLASRCGTPRFVAGSLVLLAGLVFVLVLCLQPTDYNAYVASIEEITHKPIVDEAAYYSLKLRNEMDVVIASDESLEDAEVALCVRVGSWSDPKELQGLAHFTEHVLFLGNKKYEGKGAFISHIQSNGGTLNARTGKERTCYFFSIDPDHLETAMDMFGWMMKEPLVRPETVISELQNVDSEYKRLMNQDGRRVEAVDSETSDPGHPQQMFDCGSSKNMMQGVEILKSPLHLEMYEFYRHYYSSNLMTLGVRGPFDVDTLKQLAVKNFHDIRNTGAVQRVWPDPYLQTSGKEIFVVPARDVNDLYIRFSLPNVTTARETALLKMLLRSEHSNGFVKEVKDRLWISTISIYDENYAGSTTLSIEFHLTKIGLAHRDEIVRLTFAHLNFLRERKEQEFVQLYEDLRDVERLEFKYFSAKEIRKTRRDYVYILDLVENRMTYDIDHVISGSRLLGAFDFALLHRMLQQLVPKNCRIFTVSQTFANITDRVEKFYQVQYTVRNLTDAQLSEWSKARANFSLPERNTWIPRDVQVVGTDPRFVEQPVLIANQTAARLWLLQTNFGVPKTDVTVHWKAHIDGPDSSTGVAAELILRAFRRSVSPHLYMAKNAGLNVRSSLKSRGSFGNYGSLMFGFNAYSAILPQVVDLVFDHFQKFTIDAETLRIIKDVYRISLMEPELYSTVEHCNIQERLLLQANLTSRQEKIKTLETVTIDEVHRVLNLIRKPSLVKMFVSGNMAKEMAEDMFVKIVPAVEESSYVASCDDLPRKYGLQPGSLFHYVGFDESQSQRSVTTYHEIGLISSDREVMLRELLVHIASPEAFNILRTKEQLGYGAGVISVVDGRSHGLMTYVETKNNTEYVMTRIFYFMREYLGHYIDNLTEEQFNQHRSAVMLKKLLKPVKKVERLGNELLECNCDYDREARYASILSRFTVEDIREFHRKYCDDMSTWKVIITIMEKDAGETKIGRGLPNDPTEVFRSIAEFQENLSLLQPVESSCR